MGLVTMSVPASELAETVDAIAAECAAVPAAGQRQHKETLNTVHVA
jgi:hypothetical protein